MSSDLRKLAAEFRKSAKETPNRVKATMNKAALSIKRDASRRVAARVGNKAPALPHAINYDGYSQGDNVYTVEIGFDKNRNQGPLGNLTTYGVPSKNTDAGDELDRARDKELPTLMRYLRDAADPLS